MVDTAERARTPTVEEAPVPRQPERRHTERQRAAALASRGGALFELCRFTEAEAACRDALAADPDCADAWSHLGCVLVDTQRIDDAVDAFGEALARRPDHAPTWSDFGLALRARGDLDDALLALEHAAALEPGHAGIRSNLGQCLIARGDFARGFPEFEWRLLTAPKRRSHACWPIPHWRGERFEGRTLLLHEEDGFGDTLQFVRFATAAKARGGRVVLLVREALASLLGRMAAIDAVYPIEAVAAGSLVIPDADLRCSLMSLPALLGTISADVPSPDAYLRAEPRSAASWRQKLTADRRAGDASLHVGLVWAGGSHHGIRNASLIDRRRSIALAALAPFAVARPDACFHSLQVGPLAAEACTAPAGMPLVDHSADLRTFDDTASLVMAVDLVIAVDTAAAHLAGALGRPVWMLSRHDLCWRWRTDGTGMPWYRSMRIYRQDRPGDWHAVIARVAADLASFPVSDRHDRGNQCPAGREQPRA